MRWQANLLQFFAPSSADDQQAAPDWSTPLRLLFVGRLADHQKGRLLKVAWQRQETA